MLLFALIACEPEAPRMSLSFVGSSPLEADTIANDTNGDGKLTGFVAEEITALITYDGGPATDAGAIMDVDFYEYALTYELLNAEGALGGYKNGVTIHLAAGEVGEFPIRATSFDQKFAMGDMFGGTPVNTRATLVLPYTVNGVDDGFFLQGDFDIIFADFVEPE